MEKVIHGHLDDLDALEKEADTLVEEVLSGVNVDDVVADPEAVLTALATEVKERLIEGLMPKAVELGLDLADKVKDETVEVPKTDDPHYDKDSDKV